MGCLKLSYQQERAKEENTDLFWEAYSKKGSGPEKSLKYLRYGYQGQFAEESAETGYNDFQYRSWDPVVSRWTSTDPAGQYWSPYMGMGNNPVNQVDPDGAFSKFGAWWRSGFRGSRIYEAGGEWGFNRGTGEYTWESVMVNGQEQFTRTEITEFRVGQFGEGSTVAMLTAYEPNLFGSIYNNLSNSPAHVEFTGKFVYGIIDDAYVSFGQVGSNRYHLDGSGAWPNEVQNAGVNTLMTLNPMTSLSSGIPSKTLNAGQFNKAFSGTGLNSARQGVVKAYNNMIKNYHKFLRDIVPFFNGKAIYDTSVKTLEE